MSCPKAGAIISIPWMRKLRLRLALTKHRTTVCQAELWSQFRVGGLETCKEEVPEMTKRDWEKFSVAGERDIMRLER